jgi:hypothetical protein
MLKKILIYQPQEGQFSTNSITKIERFCGTFSWHLFVKGSVAHHILSTIAWCQNVQNHIIKPTCRGSLWQMSFPFVSIRIAWHSKCPKAYHQYHVWWDAIDVSIPPSPPFDFLFTKESETNCAWCCQIIFRRCLCANNTNLSGNIWIQPHFLFEFKCTSQSKPFFPRIL